MDNELGHSELATVEYWNNRYKTDIENYKNFGYVGEIWFGEDIVGRIIEWMKQNIEKDVKIIDIGCGNGMMCIELYKEGYNHIKGIDYCVEAIQLATEIASEKKYMMRFEVGDILQANLENDVNVVLDKGTYDAISLSEKSVIDRTTYINNVSKMLKEDGFLIITSCNWTVEELVNQFNTNFELVHIIPTPKFMFGGRIGNSVASIVLKLKRF